MSAHETILITGSRGFVGTHAMEAFSKFGEYDIVGVSSKDYDLMNESSVKKMFQDIKPDYVIHLAARSGGIYSNRMEPADYYYKNIMLITQTFHHAYLNKVKKILVPMGGCSYPSTAASPIKEEVMWDGFSQIQSAGYSMAKKMVLVQSWAYKKQYDFNSVVVIPGNLYGEYDNFSLTESHVIPAMIRKFYEAKRNGTSKLTFWGTGKPQRDFVYAHDVASLFPYFLLEYGGESPINISSGTSITMKELAATIGEKVGFKGQIEWDANQPDGQMVKIFSVERLKSLGKSCDTPLEVGLEKAITWFDTNYDKGTIRL
jgi:GDP-L-fucose synthase